MFWIDGRFSWVVVFVILYATIAIVATDTAWRLVKAPIAVIGGAGLAVLLVGSAAIIVLGARAKQR